MTDILEEARVLAMSACAQAYYAEYGELPKDRAGQDRYSAFRFGYEAGQKAGRGEERRAIAGFIANRY